MVDALDYLRPPRAPRFMEQALGPIVGAALAYGAGHWWCELYTQIRYYHYLEAHPGMAHHIQSLFAGNMVIESVICAFESTMVAALGTIAFFATSRVARFRWVPLAVCGAVSCVVRWRLFFAVQKRGEEIPPLVDLGIAVGIAGMLFWCVVCVEWAGASGRGRGSGRL